MEPLDTFTIKTSHYIIAATALVAGLSWKDTMITIIDENFPTPKDNTKAKILYSIIMTFIVVLLIFLSFRKTLKI